jgi:small-conductance mechanosensitive channel
MDIEAYAIAIPPQEPGAGTHAPGSYTFVPERTTPDRKAVMNIGARSILILAAVVLFVIAFIDESSADLVALGLAAFAASFVADDFVGGRTLGRR